MNEALADEIASLEAVYGAAACRHEAMHNGRRIMVAVTVAPRREVCVTLPEGYPWPDGGAEKNGVAARMFPAVAAGAAMRLSEYCTGVACGEGEAVLYPLVSWVESEFLPSLAEDSARGHDAEKPAAEAEENRGPLERQWLWFIGFYTKSIRKTFCETAASMGCTGFLMPGKPAVSAVEGTAPQIAEFIRVTRTEVFAKVAPASRKMTLSLLDSPIAARAFTGFEEVEITAAPSTHKRKDMADLGGLQAYLAQHDLSHAFTHIFQGCVN
ncbi:hypothetical protein DIPPA_03839 [Diplonema papillatum]|nr:hypothetical protein DIPPA_03839 [Diplonema papillatum]